MTKTIKKGTDPKSVAIRYQAEDIWRQIKEWRDSKDWLDSAVDQREIELIAEGIQSFLSMWSPND